MELRSIAFNHNDPVPPKYRLVNPPLDILGVPERTRSLALIMHDPDAVSGDYIHWTVWDIDPTTTTILEDSAPTGATEGLTSAGMPGYVGPHPPQGSGRHHYIFELFALDSPLDLLPRTEPETLLQKIAEHQIARATLTGVIDA